MNRQQFRQQITQRYIAGKGIDGASLEEIGKGMLDPVEQMSYISGARRSSNQAGSGGGWFAFVGLLGIFVLAAIPSVICLFLRLLF